VTALRPVSAGPGSRLPGFDEATGWLNAEPLTLDDLEGKVVLVNFWTYTCINWLRQLPYVRRWAADYAEHGLVVVGVHTPEFGFEHDVGNVERAVHEMGIRYPVALDNDYAVWSAFGNRYWPALYFADRQSHIRHHRFGEGDYDESERIIRDLLQTRALPTAGHADPPAHGVEAPADWRQLRSPETYLGYARTANFASNEQLLPGNTRRYSGAYPLPLNHWGLHGMWAVAEEWASLSEAPGSVSLQFHARDLHLVMGPASRDKPVRFRVRIDDDEPGGACGADVSAEGFGAVTDHRLYQLVRQPGAVADRTFEITFLDPDVQVFAFTFG
jgi:thiol-disulfide isomerase/thioredoxin